MDHQNNFPHLPLRASINVCTVSMLLKDNGTDYILQWIIGEIVVLPAAHFVLWSHTHFQPLLWDNRGFSADQQSSGPSDMLLYQLLQKNKKDNKSQPETVTVTNRINLDG